MKKLRRPELHRGQAVINASDVSAMQNGKIKDAVNDKAMFEPISVQHQGVLNRHGTSSGHYAAGVKNQWYRTSNNTIPKAISPSLVTSWG